VHFNAGTGYDLTGTVTENGTDYTVNFNSPETMTVSGSGLAILSATDGNLDKFSFSVKDAKFTWFDLDFMKFAPSDIKVQVFVNDQSTAAQEFTISDNKYPVQGSATDGDYFTKITFDFADYAGTLNSGVEQVKQIGISGISPVPEPATWAMMIAGFGLVGASLRLRRNEKKALAA
jgi:hypothetical protein